MDALRINGGTPLAGELPVSGSKNATLPIMAAALLAEGESVLENAPDLADVTTLAKVLGQMGVAVRREADCLHLDATHVTHFEAPYDLVRTMRAAILVLGPLVARFGEARVSLPGGCAIGARPIDQHLKGLEGLGATIRLEHGYVIASAEAGAGNAKGAGSGSGARHLTGAEIMLDVPTVTGTENLMLAAALAEGRTIIHNAAREPEISDLAKALATMGAAIRGAGTETIIVEGRERLGPYRHRVISDRIEFGTFLVAGAIAGEGLTILGGTPEHQAALIDKLRSAGAHIEIGEKGVQVWRTSGRPRPIDVQTAAYPGFPTDMQAQLMALLATCDGTGEITETIFENRFMHVAELNRLGAAIRVEGGKAMVHGVPRLSGSTVMATDLRASACLVLAAMMADGETTVRRIYHLDRGYERIEEKLRRVGARIERFRE